MKNLSILLLLFSLLTHTLYAKEKKTKQEEQEQTIEELIKEIKNNPANRRLSINKLKIRLRTINTEIRRKIILDLQHTLGGHTIQQTHVSGDQVTQYNREIQQSTPTALPVGVPSSAPAPRTMPTTIPTSTPIPRTVPTTMPTSTPIPRTVPTTMPTSTPIPRTVPTTMPTSTPIPRTVPTTIPTSTPIPTLRPNIKSTSFNT